MHRLFHPQFGTLFLVLFIASCGGRNTLGDEPRDRDGVSLPEPGPERCNGLDDDLDGAIDEDFRDDAGRYVDGAHCGACGRPCVPRGAAEAQTRCEVIDERVVCAATACAPGFAVTTRGACASIWPYLCAGCASDADCGPIRGMACVEIGGDGRCALPCEAGCPEGTRCGDDGACRPESGSCECEASSTYLLACALTDPRGEHCPGQARCVGGLLGPCVAPEESCNGLDDDCDGVVDGPFVDARGAYFTDAHCGACGIDCTRERTPEGALVCGGDPFAPRCVLDCEDARDGVHAGDRVDADGRIETGCECVVSRLDDAPGPLFTSEGALDENCDGADGVVERSLYVAPDGDDAGPGSPTAPLRTLREAVARAAASIGTPAPRRDVFVASGEYVGTLELEDGVRIFGGYRRDFRALDPVAFRVEVRAELKTTAPGGAALVARDVGVSETRVAWLELRGRDAVASGEAAFGAYLARTGAALTLDRVIVRAGRAGDGASGERGVPGASARGPGMDGDPPRAALEDAARECVRGPENVVVGGEGGALRCGSVGTSGGEGGSASCPFFGSVQGAGTSGSGPHGGRGGRGGEDTEGPVFGSGCASPTGVCCGLADYYVPSPFLGPAPGENGGDGASGAPGAPCADPLGAWAGDAWIASRGTAGARGSAGSGGGGGGAGGGAQIDYVAGECPYADGLGGGGGGGGAGGCGGREGQPGGSGGLSVALVLRSPVGLPTLSDASLYASDGGDGGDGGPGGDGGLGGEGGRGGELPRDERVILTLSAPTPGAPGGRGGSGGKGGGGGGGCGGASIALWVVDAGAIDDAALAAYRADNDLQPGRPGAAGRGGDGPANAGQEGASLDAHWD